MDENLFHALMIADNANREHLARGGMPFGTIGAGLPGTNHLAAAPSYRGMLPGGVQPVLPMNLQHGYLKHALRMRPHFDDGGDTGGSDNTGYGGAVGNASFSGLGFGVGTGTIGGGADNTGGYAKGSFSNVGSAFGSSTGGDLGAASHATTMGRSVSHASTASAGDSGTGYGGASDPGGYGASSYGGSTYGGLGNVGSFGGGSDGYGSSGNSGGSSGSDASSSDAPSSGWSGNYGQGFGSDTGGVGSSLGDYSAGAMGTAYGQMDNVSGYGPAGIATGAGTSYNDSGATSNTPGFANAPATGAMGVLGNGGLTSAAEQGYSPTLSAGGYSSLSSEIGPSLGEFGSIAGFNAFGKPAGDSAFGTTAASSGPYGTLAAVRGFAQDGIESDPTKPAYGTFGRDATLDRYGMTPNAIQSPGPVQEEPGQPTQLGYLGVGTALGPAGMPAGLVGLRSVAGLGPTNETGDPASVDGERALTVHNVHGVPANGDMGTATNAGNIGTIGSTLGTATQPGFDNFNQGQALTGGLALNTGADTPTVADGAYTPQGWTPHQALMSQVMSPGDYSDPAKYPGLAQYTGFNSLTPNFARGFLGNFQAEGGPNLPTNAINETGGDTGLAQWTGDRKTHMLNSLGIPTGLSRDALKAALTPDTMTGQINYGVNEVATDPTYARVLRNAVNPNLSVPQQSYEVAKTFEAPKALTEDPTSVKARAEFSRRVAFSSAFSPNTPYSVGTLGDLSSYAPAAVNSALAPTHYGTFSPGAASGADAHMGSGWSSGAASGDDGDPTATGTASPGSQPAAYQAALDAAYAAMGQQPSIGSPDTPAAADTPATTDTAAPLTVHGPAATDTPAVTSTPSYFPGEKTAIKSLINAGVGFIPGVGLANTISSVLGGPNVGGWITDHSSPGSVSSLGGNGSNGSGNPPLENYVAGVLASVGLSPDGTPLSSNTSTVAPGTPTATQQTYLNAAAHYNPGPAAVLAHPSPLVPPNGITGQGYYDPMSDPRVIAAMNAAYGRRA